MDKESVLRKLESMASEKARQGMARFGIKTDNALGVSVPDIRNIAKEFQNDHPLALELWKTGIHEAMILAGLIDDPGLVTEEQLDDWVRDFDSWDVCDLVCSNLFDRTPFAWDKAVEWSGRDEEFVKRSGFVLMAALSVHDKAAPDGDFLHFFPIIKREAHDERNFVKKAVNWSIRQIGKRSLYLNREAIALAEEVRSLDSKPARWIASDALRELRSEKVHERLMKKQELSRSRS